MTYSQINQPIGWGFSRNGDKSGQTTKDIIDFIENNDSFGIIPKIKKRFLKC